MKKKEINMNSKPIEILIAEDNEDDIILMREAFEMAKIINILHVVQDGEEAIAYLHQEGKYKGVNRPGLVMLDINMPKKNGLEVLSEIKNDADLKLIPVIMLTMSAREEDVVKAYSNGASTYVRKPVKFDDFRHLIDQFALYWTLVATIPNQWSTTDK
jgi:CheY-like chemotaxis protein